MVGNDQETTTKCPDAARYDRGECGWPKCGCPGKIGENERATAAIVVIPFRRSYEAKQIEIDASGLTVIAAGTLDGFIDFVVRTGDGRGLTYQITRDDARAVIAALHAVVADITANCLFDRDPLLMPEGT